MKGDCSTYHTEHLLLNVKLVINELNYAVYASKPLEQVDLSLEALHRVLIRIFK